MMLHNLFGISCHSMRAGRNIARSRYWHSPLTALALLLSLTASLQALAGPAYDFTSVNLYGNSYGITQTAGFLFTPTTDIRVTSLGFFDYLGDGLGESHQLGIFDATGNLLVSAFLPSGTASPLENGFRYVDIVPLALAAGQDYTMAAFLATQADVVGYLNVADLVVDPVVGLSSVPARYIVPSGTELMFPTQTALLFTSFFLGPNFKLSATESIPLPGTLVLGGPMLGVLLVVGRRQSAKRDPI